MKRIEESKVEYDIWHKKLNENKPLDKISFHPWHHNALSILENIVHIKDLNILEVGCGSGDFSIYLAQNGAKVTAIDFSEEAIKLAKLKANNQAVIVDFLVDNAQSLSFPSHFYDIVFSFECLEHLPAPQLMLNECFRVLKKEGKLILTTENYSNAMVLAWIKAWLSKQPFNSGSGVQPIENFFVFWKVKKMFKKAGFKKLTLSGSHHVFLLLPRFHPNTFVKDKFKNFLFKYVFKPWARHMTYFAKK